MNLARILEGITVTKMFQTMYGRMVVTHDVEVNGLHYDSRRVGRGDMFVAIRGTAADGHAFIGAAIQSGAKVVMLEDDAVIPDSFFGHAGVIKVVVPNSRIALAIASANIAGRPAAGMKVIGVTGTNGKTTSTHLIKSILEARGERVGLIGTIAHTIGEKIVPAQHTTPESLELHQLLAEMKKHGCSSVVMEVSSHALVMHRVYGIPFAAGVFTNLTQDHLDFHGTMEEYFRAKKMLFDSLPASASAISNLDDPYGRSIAGATVATLMTYATGTDADVTAENVTMRVDGTTMTVKHRGGRSVVNSSLTGRFNVQNILAAYATGAALEIPDESIIRGIGNVTAVAGRFEQIVAPQGWTAVIDYAHTPDALENCLRTIHDIMPPGGRIITVFGCGGDRDRAKRPRMGEIASRLSDVTVVTSDNPRREDPAKIIDDILAGVVKGKDVIAEVNRRHAIQRALVTAGQGDIVLIAGKGHEKYQVIDSERLHFDDREEVEGF
ncbi:MAG: UDP-N-acetylmuramoyl-L-alanyl-D-glutamate--2,6-diaminopimelate ligase, partial [Ignavibacteria bacterium]|nr:UDP-N-acetylmuramoyl-L-alanyl-D-glutamate--2,6-diaminopimelate ligase [Ignavibacteria bacterium]